MATTSKKTPSTFKEPPVWRPNFPPQEEEPVAQPKAPKTSKILEEPVAQPKAPRVSKADADLSSLTAEIQAMRADISAMQAELAAIRAALDTVVAQTQTPQDNQDDQGQPQGDSMILTAEEEDEEGDQGQPQSDSRVFFAIPARRPGPPAPIMLGGIGGEAGQRPRQGDRRDAE